MKDGLYYVIPNFEVVIKNYVPYYQIPGKGLEFAVELLDNNDFITIDNIFFDVKETFEELEKRLIKEKREWVIEKRKEEEMGWWYDGSYYEEEDGLIYFYHHLYEKREGEYETWLAVSPPEYFFDDDECREVG